MPTSRFLPVTSTPRIAAYPRRLPIRIRPLGGPVVMILGNHEHYDGKIDRTLDKIAAPAAQKHITILENQEVIISGVRVLGCTLWTDFRLFAGDNEGALRGDATRCAERITDFRTIRIASDGYRRFRPKDAAILHSKSVTWLRDKFKEPFDGPTVVVTHHAPSRRSIPQIYAEDHTSAAYASDLEWLILEGSPALWIHGHIHTSQDYRIGDTRVICNPRGYWPIELNPEFNERLVVEV
ncbi:metallophosphoesterase [Lacibacterium aquatile]|uniref:Metallophosphoesterase n=1 Tax=Lacibacterium aquatile TaxID=1168082 RepID=A0ABW5DLL3_9PROT